MIRGDYRRLGQGWETGSRVAKITYCLSVVKLSQLGAVERVSTFGKVELSCGLHQGLELPLSS